MRIFKFGGASVKDAKSIQNVTNIITSYKEENLIIIVSAMGKMTNALERLINAYCFNKDLIKESFLEIQIYHNDIIRDLFPDFSHPIYVRFNELISQIEDILSKERVESYDYTYDQLICYGELISTSIISHYLNDNLVSNKWLDARKILKSDSNYREGRINWISTEKNCKEKFDFSISKIYITQGFIASDNLDNSVSLGREGSDYTAAVIGYCLGVSKITIWKDVAGILNADPRIFPDAKKIDRMSYREAIELAYYGATVIHPKTVQPIQQKQIKLYVKSFINPLDEGTVIEDIKEEIKYEPAFIVKNNQILFSIRSKDFSFMVEDHIGEIFKLMFKYKAKANMIQNSAVSFCVCTDYDEHKTPNLVKELEELFTIRLYENVHLLTIRHYTDKIIEENTKGYITHLFQQTHDTTRFVLE